VDLALTLDCANKIFLKTIFFRNSRQGPIGELIAVAFCEQSFVSKLGMLDSVVDY
jgi:hypothetical protein